MNFQKLLEYKFFIDALPEIILIIKEGKIILANKKAEEVQSALIGADIREFIKSSFEKAQYRLSLLSDDTRSVGPSEYEVTLKNGEKRHFEMISTFITIEGMPAALTTARDITSRKKDLVYASLLQKKMMYKKLPEVDGLEFGTVYVPAKSVSGDLYFMKRINQAQIIGIIGDISGKGLSAAMSVSAFEVIFHESVKAGIPLMDFVELLSQKVSDYLMNTYVAAIVYLIDLDKGTIELTGAGINEFYAITSKGLLKRYELKGPSLGMFEHLSYDSIKLTLQEITRLILYTDGISDQIFAKEIDPGLFKEKYLYRLVMNLTGILEQRQLEPKGLHDDSTAVMLDFHSHAKSTTHVLYGLKFQEQSVSQVLDKLLHVQYREQVQSIIHELLLSAFKYGNAENEDLPIRLTVLDYMDRIIIEVTDLGILPKQVDLLSSEATNRYSHGNSVIVEIEVK